VAVSVNDDIADESALGSHRRRAAEGRRRAVGAAVGATQVTSCGDPVRRLAVAAGADVLPNDE